MIAISFKSDSGDNYLEVSRPDALLPEFVKEVKSIHGKELAFFNIVCINTDNSILNESDVNKAFKEAIEEAKDTLDY